MNNSTKPLKYNNACIVFPNLLRFFQGGGTPLYIFEFPVHMVHFLGKNHNINPQIKPTLADTINSVIRIVSNFLLYTPNASLTGRGARSVPEVKVE